MPEPRTAADRRPRWRLIAAAAMTLMIAAGVVAALPASADVPPVTTLVPAARPVLGNAVISNQVDNLGSVGSTAVTASGTVWAVQTVRNSEYSSNSRLIRLPNDSLVPQVVEPALDSYAPGEGAVLTTAGEMAYVARSVDPGQVQLRRYLANGRWDRTFGTLGTADLTGHFGEACAVQLVPAPIEGWPEPEPDPPCVYAVRSVAVDANGAATVLISARSTTGQHIAQTFLVRSTADGELDLTFGAAGVAPIPPAPESYANTVKHVVDAQNRLIVSHYGGYSAASIAFDRFSSNGQRDAGFGDAGRVTVAVPGARLTCATLTSSPDCLPVPHPDGSFAFATAAVLTSPENPAAPYVPYVGVVDDNGVQLRQYCGGTGYFPTGGCSLFLGATFATIEGQLHLVGSDASASLTAIPFPLPDSGNLKDHELSYLQAVEGRPTATYAVASGDIGGPIVARIGRYSVSTPESYETFDVIGRVDLDDLPGPSSGWVSPQSGSPAVSSPLSVEFACQDAPFCAAVVVDGEVPSPLPPGWSPAGSQVITSGHQLDTSEAGVRTVLVVTVGSANQILELARARYDIGGEPVLPGDSGTTSNGGMFSTGGAPSSDDWLNTDLSTPVGGAVRVHETSQPGATLAGYQWFPVSAEVDAPEQDAASPLTTTFRVHRGALDSLSASSLVVAHDGIVVPTCVGRANATAADPAPCVMSRRNLSSSVAEVTVLSTGGDAGVWAFGRVTATVPGGVTGIWAEPSVRSANLWWSALSLEAAGGAPVREYRIVATPIEVPDGVAAGVRTVVLPGEAVAPGRLFGSVTRLVPGVTYEFTMSARNHVLSGWGAVAAAPEPVAIGGLPDAPSSVSAAAQIRSAEVTWATPDSAEPVVSYSVVGIATRTDGTTHRVSKKVTGDPVPSVLVVTGLLPGLSYSFTVSASSAVGTGGSASSAPVMIAALPEVPSAVTAVAGVRSAAVAWDAPSSDEPLTKYTAVGTAVRPDGSTHRVTKTVAGDPLATSVEVTGLLPGLSYSFTVSASSAVGTSRVSTPSAPVTPDFGISIGDRSATEGNRGQKSFSFTISLTHVQDAPVTVDVATADATADGSDYVPVTTSVTFEPGQKTRAVTVRVVGDTAVEPDETFFVDISNASSGTITKARGVGTVRNDD